MEYAPQPPYGTGRPELADTQTLAAARAALQQAMGCRRVAERAMKHTIGIGVSAFAIVAAGCAAPTEPDPSQLYGVWIGTSRVISCEHPSGGCVNYAAGHERYLNLGLTQSGDDVTGSLSPAKGGPLVLPPRSRSPAASSPGSSRSNPWVYRACRVA